MSHPVQPTGGGLSVQIPAQYRRMALAAARVSGVPPKVLAAQIDDESGWNPRATSGAGAQGIAQFEPSTWAAYNRIPGASPYQPGPAFKAYGRFMGYLLHKYKGNLRDALAAYNAGPANIQAGYGYADTILQAAGEPYGATGTAGVPYRNPLRGIRGLVPERVDQGVDYSGSGPIYALGKGVITEVDQSWAGGYGGTGPGTFIEERITQGPLRGRYVYAAENIQPSPGLRKGQQVTASTVLGQVTGGIETGFAAGPSQPGTTAAMAAGQTPGTGDPGAQPTAYGAAYSRLLHDLGAPAGTVSGKPVGTLPAVLRDILGGISPITDLTGVPGSGVAGAIQRFTDSVSGLGTAIDWLVQPENWVRIIAGVAGGVLVLGGIFTLSHVGGGIDVPMVGEVKAPAALPVGILEVGAGGVLLFVAFHNLGAANVGELFGQLRTSAQQGAGQ